MKAGDDTQRDGSGGVELTPTTHGPWWRDVIGLLIAAGGAALCIEAYLEQHSLFIDEMRLLESVLTRSWGELTQPLAQEQAAPVGFLLLLKLSIEWIGDEKSGFRAVPMAAAVVSMVLFWVLIRQLVRGWPALLGMAVFATGSWTTYYAQQTKQYTLELAVALALFCLLAWIARRGLCVWRLAVFAAAGAIATWLSVTAVLVLAGCGVVLLVLAIRSRSKRLTAVVIGVGLVWIASFLAKYWLVLSSYRESEYLVEFWQAFYLRVIPRLPHRVWGQLSGVFNNPVDLQMHQLGFGLWLIGLCVAVRSRRALPWALAVGWAILAGLSFAGKYPYGERQVLFALPMLIGLMVVGLAWLRTLGRPGEVLALGAGLLVVAGPVFTAGNIQADDKLEPVVLELRERVQEGDIVWIDGGARYIVGFLAARSDDFDLAPATVRYSELEYGSRHWMFDELQGLQGHPRVWLLMSHAVGRGGLDEIKLVLTFARQMGKQLDHIEDGDSSATLFDFTAAPDPRPTPPGPRPDIYNLPVEFKKTLPETPDAADPHAPVNPADPAQPEVAVDIQVPESPETSELPEAPRPAAD